MSPGRTALSCLLCAIVVTGCADSHGRVDAGDDAGEAAVQIGTGCGGFEALPFTGGTVELSPHPRGGFGICTPVRVRGFTDSVEIRVEANHPETAEVVAAPREDEPYRVRRMDGAWGITDGVMLLFDPGLDPAELDGRSLWLNATAEDGTSRATDQRRVTVVAPGDEACAGWRAEIGAEWNAIRACTDASECGQDIPLGCGCTRNAVGRTDADITRFMELIRDRPIGADGFPCTHPEIPEGSPCDCPPADGYACNAGVCEWNLL